MLIHHYEDINSCNIEFRTPTHLAVVYNHKHILKGLLSISTYGVNLKDFGLNTPLFHAVYQSNLNSASISDFRKKFLKKNFSNFFQFLDSLAMVKILLQHKANTSIENFFGQTALDLAIKLGYSKLIETLINHNPDELKERQK